MKNLSFLIAGVLLVAGGMWYGIAHQSAPLAGSFNPTGGSTYYLQSPINATQVTIALSSFKEPGSNIAYTMSYLNSDIEYATINPTGPSNPTGAKSEFISFTGITQNSNGTALLTGVTRGLEKSYPYGASSTLAYAAPGQTQLILSSPPQFFNEYASKRNTQVISGQWQFTTLPTSTIQCANADQLCNKQYVDNLALQGAATSTFVSMGLVQLAYPVQMASGTASSTTQKPLVISTKFSTTTPGLLCTNGIWNCLPVAQVSGKISQLWLDLTQAFTFSGGLTSSGNTSIAASVAHPLTLNGLNYTFPTAQAGSSTIAMQDGSGNVTWELLNNIPSLLLSTTTAQAMAYATTSTFSGFNKLQVMIFEPAASANGICLSFNSDFSTNYGSVNYQNGLISNGTWSNQRAAFFGTTIATTTDETYFVSINNQLAKRKEGTETGSLSNSGANAPQAEYGSFVWNNTSAQITNLVVSGNCQGPTNVPAGTIISVYGVN